MRKVPPLILLAVLLAFPLVVQDHYYFDHTTIDEIVQFILDQQTTRISISEEKYDKLNIRHSAEMKLDKSVSSDSVVAHNIYEIMHSKAILKEYHKLYEEEKKEMVNTTYNNPFQAPGDNLHLIESVPDITIQAPLY